MKSEPVIIIESASKGDEQSQKEARSPALDWTETGIEG